jgi:fatty acid desaturase
MRALGRSCSHPGFEGFGKLAASTLATGASSFTNPILAAALGLTLGVGLLLISRVSIRLMTADDPALGLAKVAVTMVIRMAVVIAALIAYYVWARPGLVPFGAALVVGFFVMVTVELFTLSRRAAPSEGGR